MQTAQVATVPIDHGLILAAILFVIGMLGLLARNNVLFILMSIEVMMNAAGLAFITAGFKWGQADGQVMFIFILAVAAAEVCVGLALVLRLHQEFKSLNSDTARDMRG